jgi:general secretion pathway protein C
MFLKGIPKITIPALPISRDDLGLIGQRLFILVALTIAIFGSVGLFYDILSISFIRSSVPVGKIVPEPQTQTVAIKQPADTFALIPQRNLFGSTDKAIEDRKGEAAPAAPDISQLIEVKGTIAGTGKDGFAVLEERGKNKQLLYKVGNVVGGATIVQINRHAVVFSVGGVEKTLKMAQTNERPLLPPRPSALPAAPASSGAATVINRNEIESSLKDMGTMLSQAQIRPYYTEGAPDGFIISNIRPGSVYEKVGLMNGDVIQGADDRRLITAEDVTSLYNTLKAGSSLTLRVLRGGRQETLQFAFR